jgi:hypothetical protein
VRSLRLSISGTPHALVSSAQYLLLHTLLFSQSYLEIVNDYILLRYNINNSEIILRSIVVLKLRMSIDPGFVESA